MNTWHRATLAAVVTCGALLPFVGKAFHIDDTLFLYTARQILCDPLRPFDFEVNWYGTPRPMWEITKNPPLNSYWLAALVGLFGESETALHLGFLPFSVASIVLMYLLAARLTSEPLLPALMLLASPSFLVSATNVMCDVPLLACWLGSVLAFMHGLERRDWRLLGLAGVLAGLAGLTKYTGLSLVPLLLAYAWLRRRSLPKESLVLLIPIVMVGAWSLHGTILQGKSHVLDTTSYQFPRRYSFSSLMVQGFACLTFTGGCSFGLALLLPWMKKRRWHWAVAALGTVLVSALTPPALWEDLGVGHSCLALLMAFAGLMLICVAVRGAQEGIAGEGALLLLWLAGMLFYVAVVNWTVAGRFVLLAMPPLILLAMRRAEKSPSVCRWAAVGLSLLLSLALAHSDCRYAKASAAFAETVRGMVGKHREAVWFTGHWGFQYYVEREGFKPLDLRNVQAQPGDCVVVPRFGDHVALPPSLQGRLTGVEGREYPGGPLHVMNPVAHAGFYTHGQGILPFSVAAGVPVQAFGLWRVEAHVVRPP